MSKVWLGSIWIKDEGGYEIILKSLRHYSKRLRNVESSPELSDAPMFSQIVLQEAMKTKPIVDKIIEKISNELQDMNSVNELQNNIPLLEKALNSYHNDLEKALQNSHPYYTKLIESPNNLESDLLKIKTALDKIQQFEN